MTLKHKLKSSTARAALKRTIEAERVAGEAVNAAKIKLDKADDQEEHAQRLARDAQVVLQQKDAAEAAEVGKTWPPRSLTAAEKQSRRDAEDNLAAAARALKVVQSNANAVRKVHDDATLALGPIQKEIDAAVLAVMVEEAELAIERWCEARKAAIETEKAVRSFIQVLTQRQCFAEVERLSNKFRDLGRQREYEIDPTPYQALFDRLRSDPDAVVLS